MDQSKCCDAEMDVCSLCERSYCTDCFQGCTCADEDDELEGESEDDDE